MGKLLISGNGKQLPSIKPILLFVGGLLLLLGIIFLITFADKWTGAIFCLIGGVIVLAAALWPEVWKETYFAVYENGADIKAAAGPFALRKLFIPYAQIQNIALTDNAIVVYTAYGKFKAYTKDNENIYNLIQTQGLLGIGK